MLTAILSIPPRSSKLLYMTQVLAKNAQFLFVAAFQFFFLSAVLKGAYCSLCGAAFRFEHVLIFKIKFQIMEVNVPSPTQHLRSRISYVLLMEYYTHNQAYLSRRSRNPRG